MANISSENPLHVRKGLPVTTLANLVNTVSDFNRLHPKFKE